MKHTPAQRAMHKAINDAENDRPAPKSQSTKNKVKDFWDKKVQPKVWARPIRPIK